LPKPSKLNFPLVNEFPYLGHAIEELLCCLGVAAPLFIWESSGPSKKQESSVHLDKRYSYIGLTAAKYLSIVGETVKISSPTSSVTSPIAEFDGELLQPLAESLKLTTKCTRRAEGVDSPVPFTGGAIGFLSHDSARYFERVVGLKAETAEPDLFFVFPETFLAIDHHQQKIFLITTAEHSNTVGTEDAEFLDNLLKVHGQFADKLKLLAEGKCASLLPNRASALVTTAQVTARFSKSQFVTQVERAKDYIKAGDVYQVILANTFTTEFFGDSLDVYLRLKSINPSPYHFYLPFADNKTLVGASPEVMLKSEPRSKSVPHSTDNSKSESDQQLLKMRLVAGTYPRELATDSERHTIEKLKSDEKERAEHVMLIDHARNDIGRVAEIGSVEVSDMLSVETYKEVHHLVSQVSGVLKSEYTVLDALRSCHPISTLTGTPKIRAMEIIAELESASRGVYGGTICMIGNDGSLDSAVVIRSVILDGEKATIRAGAGIVYDSVPEREFQECYWKAQAVLAALGVSDDRDN